MKNWMLAVLLMFGGLATIGLSGCASNKIDWAPRIGTYTFDDAVREMGPPDKEATLTDGTVVADWITTRGGPRLYTVPQIQSGYYGGHYIWNEAYTMDTPDWIVRLEFGPDGKLTKHTRVVR